jgi:hypothetical protein
MWTNRRAIVIIWRSCSDSLLRGNQTVEFSEATMDKRLRERPAGDLDRGSWRVTWNRRSVGIRAAEIALAVVTFTIGLVGAEMACRVIDGYELWSAHLVRIPTSPSPTSHAAAVAKVATEHAAQIPPAAGMKGEWFSLSPPPVSRRSTNPTFERIAKRYTASMLTFELFHVYNSSFIAQQMCKDYFRRFPGFFFVYDPPAGTEYPRYRFPLNEVTPYGLVTNQFGWRGPPIELRKAANTIRIAFVGASTSVNDHSFPYSYPEFAGFFLDSWAREVFGVRVEMINAGREGITSTDIAAVVRDEVLPLEPDLVVYYEGSNQFRPGSIIRLVRILDLGLNRAHIFRIGMADIWGSGLRWRDASINCYPTRESSLANLIMRWCGRPT